MKKIIVIIIGVILLAISAVTWKFVKKESPIVVTTFEECVQVGNPVAESYPRQCHHGGVTYAESIGNELEKTNLIRVNSPRPNQIIESPLVVRGEARGYWFFEASFPIIVTDWDGLIIGQGIATAKSEWMTEDFVPFEAIINFTVHKNTYSKRGALILRKDNPSGLPEHDDALEIPVVFN